jgi:hypothetical protein
MTSYVKVLTGQRVFWYNIPTGVLAPPLEAHLMGIAGSHSMGLLHLLRTVHLWKLRQSSPTPFSRRRSLDISCLSS